MSIDDITKLIDSFSRLIVSLFWPAFLLIIIFKFRDNIREIISSLGEVSLKGAGFEASAKIRRSEAATALVVASTAKKDDNKTPESSAISVKNALDLVGNLSNYVLNKL